jgi:hypothetical protein
MADTFVANAQSAGIPMDVLHRIARHGLRRHGHVAAQRRGDHVAGGDGLTHRQAYKDIFAITLIKTGAVFVAIGAFYAFGIV